jgi:hypothetical protein
LGGFSEHLTAKVKRLTVLAGLASRIPDAVLSVLMVDDRPPAVLQEIDREVELEMEYVSSLPPGVWQELACLVACSSEARS